MYNIASGTWSKKFDLDEGRLHHAASVIDGRIYVVGGQNVEGTFVRPLDTMEVYNPEKDVWEQIDFPMNYPRSRFASGVHNGVAYVAGGWGTELMTDSVERFIP